MKQIVFIADNVSHVRTVPDNVSRDDVIQQYYVDRAAKKHNKKPFKEKKQPTFPLEVKKEEDVGAVFTLNLDA